MGGYIALYISSLIDTNKFNDKKIICIPIVPQTLSFENNIFFHKDIKKYNYKVDNLKNIISKNNNNVKRYILIGKYILDALAVGNLLGLKNTKIIVTPFSFHNIWKFINHKIFDKLIIDNFNTFFTNMDEGSYILNNDLEFLTI